MIQLGLFPIGELSDDTGLTSGGAGTVDVSGAAVGTVAVAGAAAQTVAITGTATAISAASDEEASYLGYGPIASGPIGAYPSIALAIGTGAGAGAGTVDVTGTAEAMALITGRAPDIVFSPWTITVGDAQAVISAYPAPPTTPAWQIVVENPGFRIADYPAYVATVPNVPFVDITGSATTVIGYVARASGTVNITGAAVALGPVTPVIAGTVAITGASTGTVSVAAAGAGTVGITGASIFFIGDIPVTGIGAGDVPIDGAGLITLGNNAIVAGLLDMTGTAVGTITISGVAYSIMEITGSAEIRALSQRRNASAKGSVNSVEILTEEQANKLLGRRTNG